MNAEAGDQDDALVQLIRQLRLDHLAVAVSRRLGAAGVPHAIVKGPTTSLWLYSPPREYRDVDVLVPPSRLQAAAGALVDAGLVLPEHADPGELAAHSLVLTAVDGAEVDLHLALPGMGSPSDDSLWDALAVHVVPFDLGGHRVPALDVVGRCLVLSLHAVMAGPHDHRPWADLRRALDVTTREDWEDVERLAVTVGLEQHVHAATAHARGRSVTGVSPEIALLLGGASGSAVQLERLARLPLLEGMRLARRELFPTRTFVSAQFPALAGTRFAYARGWWRRTKSLVGGLKSAVTEVRDVRRNARIR